MFLEMAEARGIVRKLNMADMYQKTLGDQIYQKALIDSQTVLVTFPEVIKKGDERVPNEILIGDEGYCCTWISSIYAGMRVARDIGANCLFSKREHTF